MSFSVRPGHVFRIPCLIALRILAVVGLKISACKYWASSGFEVCARIFSTKFSDFCVPRGNSHIPVLLFLVPLIISFPLFCIDISCLSSVMIHTSSNKIPNDINGAVCVYGKMEICLSCLIRPGSCSVAMCVNSIVIPYGSIDFISF